MGLTNMSYAHLLNDSTFHLGRSPLSLLTGRVNATPHIIQLDSQSSSRKISEDIKMSPQGNNRQICNLIYLNLLLAFNAFLLTSAWIVDFNNPIVHTQYGSIKGKIDERRTKFNRRPICSFLSIPYARPPVGSNRFLVSRFAHPIVCDAFA